MSRGSASRGRGDAGLAHSRTEAIHTLFTPSRCRVATCYCVRFTLGRGYSRPILTCRRGGRRGHFGEPLKQAVRRLPTHAAAVYVFTSLGPAASVVSRAPPPTPHPSSPRYVFPGLGLAASVAGIAEITDGMLFAAAVACVDSLTPEEVAERRTFPELSRARQVRGQRSFTAKNSEQNRKSGSFWTCPCVWLHQGEGRVLPHVHTSHPSTPTSTLSIHYPPIPLSIHPSPHPPVHPSSHPPCPSINPPSTNHPIPLLPASTSITPRSDLGMLFLYSYRLVAILGAATSAERTLPLTAGSTPASPGCALFNRDRMLFLEVGRYSLRQGSILTAANRHQKPINASSTHATPTGEPRGGMRSHREGVFGGGRHAPEAGGSAYMGGAPRLCPRKD
eukprot:scaffold4260_cov94-Isochrysis_galbana.AAC.1